MEAFFHRVPLSVLQVKTNSNIKTERKYEIYRDRKMFLL